ncbi:hypothetical protein ACOT81_43650 [Streptomyces sp. WI04-05B]|uniref:hypothetical protein n=1 Tax=Streptomyces TaxID=1883 RepID=UPI0029BD14A1|nr:MULTISPECIES: hypothetical protein [unclassified Streptomyces]MDX2543287.1 hypothetical protein [Streptomyces sp. WI04-05B]MDX2586689.1 hypothetical protein [Streptomyces sp. WI04-05A]
MTPRTGLENRPLTLWRLAEPLWSRIEEGERLTQGQLDAVVEAFFRIGVHPGTHPVTALNLLARAHRLDGANPKHPYHVGLLYLRHGRPEAAVRWLTAAATLSPVNHRVWAHLSLAYRGLDEQRSGTPGYDGEHRARAEEIGATIRDGHDDFDPEAGEPPLPLLRPGVCRWTGVHDMAADGRLRGRTAERTRDTLFSDLEAVAGLVDRRRGGAASFTVLAVQWMVYGYPPATVRRLMKLLPPDDGAAAGLLSLVCDLFEADRGDLPARLAVCLSERSLPDVLVALIHRQRLFRRPLRFPDLGAHAAARAFTDGDPARHEKALAAAWRALAEEPPDPMADVTLQEGSEETRTAGPDERLAVFTDIAATLKNLREDAQAHAKDLAQGPVTDGADHARTSGDREVLTELVDRLEAVRLSWVEELRRFKGAEPVGLVMPFTEFQRRLEECEAEFQEPLGSVRAVLKKRVDRKLAKYRGEFTEAGPTPSPEALSLAARLTELEGPGAEESSGAPTPAPGSAPPARRPAAPPPPPLDADARARVAHALAMAEERLRTNFAEARITLEAYPPESRHREAVTLLRAYLGGQQAEAELRLGRTTDARRHWNTMLADDPLHPGVLRNLAVAHTSAGDLAHAGLAWRRCLEALYLRDLLHGDIRRGAAERAEVHRVLAGSFGTAPLVQGLTPRSELEEDPRQIPPVLAGKGKVGTAVAHLRLDELNHILTHRSPTLLLGVGRLVDEAELAAARGRRRAAVTTAVAALPARVRRPFEEACVRLIEEAHTEASRTRGRTRRPGDEAEEQAHLAWARSRVLWKLAINKAVVQDAEADWALTEYSGDVLGNLRLVDALPLDPTDDMVLSSVRQLGLQGDAVVFVRQLNKLGELACERAVSRVFEVAGETASGEADRFPDRFRRIGRSWVRNSVPDRYIDFLNDPQGLYFPSIRSAFAILNTSGTPADDHERKVVAAAVTALERWMRRLPGATGPAVVLARLLSSLDRYDEVEAVLSRAGGEAFDERGRQKLTPAYIRLDIDRGRYAGTVPRIRTLLAAEPDDEQLRGLLVYAYDRWIGSGKSVPSTRAVAEDFAHWTDEETVELRRRLVLRAAMAAYLSRHETGGTGPLVSELGDVCLRDPGNTQAAYHLVEALHKHAFELRREMQGISGERRRALRTEFQKLLVACEEQAVALLSGDAIDEEQRARLREIIRNLRRPE